MRPKDLFNLLNKVSSHSDSVTSSVLLGTGAHCVVIQRVIRLPYAVDLKLPLTGVGYLWFRSPSKLSGEITSCPVKSMSVINKF